MDSRDLSDLGISMVLHGIEEEFSFEWQVPRAHAICDRGISAINMPATRATILVFTLMLKTHSIATKAFYGTPHPLSKFTERHPSVRVFGSIEVAQSCPLGSPPLGGIQRLLQDLRL